MSAAETHECFTDLRAFERRTRGLPLETQMVECVDLLQSPELVIDDLVRSVAQVQAGEAGANGLDLRSDRRRPDDPASVFFYPTRDLFVKGDRCSFTCLATDLGFREPIGEIAEGDGGDATREGVEGVEGDGSREGAGTGGAAADGVARIDFAGITCEARPLPVLGFVQSTEGESAYPLLLRALASLLELVGPRRFDLLDRDVYRGLLGPAPAFDLSLVIWDDDVATEAGRSLCELSRDLAEVLKSALAREPRFPPVLDDIVCLRMNPHRFDGRLRAVWRV